MTVTYVLMFSSVNKSIIIKLIIIIKFTTRAIFS